MAEFPKAFFIKTYSCDFWAGPRGNALTEYIGTKYLGDLIQKTESNLLSIPGIGKKTVETIKTELAKHNLRLGMQIEGWPPENVEEIAKSFEDHF